MRDMKTDRTSPQRVHLYAYNQLSKLCAEIQRVLVATRRGEKTIYAMLRCHKNTNNSACHQVIRTRQVYLDGI
jgi:hypothetical protein